MATEAAERHAGRGGKLRGVVLGVMAAALLGLVAPAWAKDSVPDWVKAAAAETLPSYPPDTNAVVLLSQTTYTVDEDGKALEHHREVLRILRPQGRDYGIVAVPHNKDSKLNYLHVWSIGPDGREYQVKDNEMIEAGSESEGLVYDDSSAREANAPGRDPGGVVAFEYEQHCLPYFTEQTEMMQREIPIHRLQLTIKLPSDFDYKATWKGRDTEAPVSLGNNTYEWTLNDVPGVNLENVKMAPASDALEARVTLHYFSPKMETATRGDWESEGEATWRLDRDRVTPTPEITAKAQELTAGKTDFAEKVKAIYDYVQDFRYFDIALGIGGFQPHYAAEIFAHKYGDCKDKSTIMTAMLGAIGIHSAPVIVDTDRGVMTPNDPSEYADHQINAIEIPDGYTSPLLHTVVTLKNGKHYLIADATYLPDTPFGDIEGDVQGSYALLADGGNSQMIQIPVLDPHESRVHLSGNFTISADDTLSGSLHDSYFGESSLGWRERLINLESAKKRDYVQSWLGNFVPNFTLTSFDSDNLTAYSKDLKVNINFSAANYARAMGPMLLVRPCVVGLIGYDIDTKPRKYPVELSEPYTLTSEFSIQLPAGYKVDDLPDPVKVDDGFASYESKTTVDGNTLHYTRTFVQRAVELPPEKYDDLRKLDEIISNDQRSEVVLKKAS